MSKLKKKKVSIVVLGDIGRSPRMQYHGLSFLEEGYEVEFIGYSGSEPLEKLKSNRNVNFRYMYQPPDFKQSLPTILAYIAKVIWQIVTLSLSLLIPRFPDFVLVQNPPSVPSLAVCYFFCVIFQSKLIIDWHNYAYSILSLSLGELHTLVKLSKAFEFYFGKKAHSNICVTKAMKEDLGKNHNINAVTCYDRPPDFFKKTSTKQKHALFLKLGLQYDIFLKDCNYGETVFTKVDKDLNYTLRDDRPALLISSTSWTEDEDFSLLLSALEGYEQERETSDELPELVCAITGKGPLKEFYMKVIEKKNWKHVHVITPWLEPEDYPLFLGSGDLGVCLHKSSSGLDLPMKVVDMFGCGLPVCAIQFPCLNELVKHEENGFVFTDEKELFQQLKKWFQGFPNSKQEISKTFEKNLTHFQSLRWHDNWKFNVQSMF